MARRLEGWPIVGWSAVVLSAMAGGIVLWAGTGPAGVRLVLRATAATSTLLFLGAFAAGPLQRRWPGAITDWLRANRRYVGLSFAVSHGVHLIALVSAVRLYSDALLGPAGVDPATLYGGGLAYVFLALMVATSFDRTAAWVGPRAWAVLHTTGMYYLWGIFLLTYSGRVFHAIIPGALAVLLLATMSLRVATAVHRRRTRAAA